jgi:hypothetical protein
MYDGGNQLLVAKPIDRYHINAPMLPELKKDADGSLTLYIQKDEPTDPGPQGQLAAGAGRANLAGNAAILAEGRRIIR